MIKQTIRFASLACIGASLVQCTHPGTKANAQPNEPLSYADATAKADSVLNLMTIDEKITLIGGTDYFYSQTIPRLGIPRVMMTDATAGVHLRSEFMGTAYTNALDKSTAFPAPISLAATWNRQLAFDYAKSIGQECRANGIGVLLGPGMNIYRVSQCGRNFEYFGEDPFLAGQMVANYVKGVQSTGVIATLKHFLANNTDFFRRKSNSVVDERAIHEIYTPAFRAGIEAGARAVMTSYNLLNGEWCGQSEYVINQLLRKDLGFEWLVMTDWWSVYDGQKLIQSGQCIEMPSRMATDSVKFLLDEGKVSETNINDMVRHLLATYYSMNTFSIKPDTTLKASFIQHELTALQTAREGIVMLKNNGVLPITDQATEILVTGYSLDEVLRGGGSGEVDGYNHTILRKALYTELGDRAIFNENATDDEIRKAQVVILNIGTQDFEGYDRPFELPKDVEERIRKVVSLNANTVVVVQSGSGIRMTDWNDKANAILYAWYPGQNGAIAISEVLCGKVNPSGKLPMTIEREFKDTPGYGYMKGEPFYKGWNSEGENAHPVYDVHYDEGILVGYRWFDTKAIEPLYHFGHGISYSCFDYSNLSIVPTPNGDAGEYDVSLNVKNIGEMDGADVIQLYVNDAECSVLRPAKELKAFDKVMIKAGETASVKLHLSRSDFAYYDVSQKQWIVEPGMFNILIGRSSKDIRIKGEVMIAE